MFNLNELIWVTYLINKTFAHASAYSLKDTKIDIYGQNWYDDTEISIVKKLCVQIVSWKYVKVALKLRCTLKELMEK